MEEHHYLIRGGIAGRERLRVLARVMRPGTLALLERAGVTAGLRCLDVPAFSVQFHPEAAAGPHDAAPLFQRFVDLMEENRNA